MANTALIFISVIVTALSYTYFISSRISKGKYRFISLLSIFYLFTILPLLLSSAVATFVATLCITWLANFKLLLFAFDLGPLTSPKKTLIQFIAIASLPVVIKPHFFNPRKKSHLYFWTETFVSPFLINFAYNHKHELNPYVFFIVNFVILFLLLDLLVLVSNAVVGLETQPPSDDPYMSTSLQDFWGRRWNLTVTNILRHTVYKPVRSVFPPAEDWAAVPAIMATFVVSGLMHEVVMYYLTRVGPTWEMTRFFVLHGTCLVVELKVKRAVAGKFEVPAVVGRLLTVGFMILTGFWLFFPPVVKNGVDMRVLEELKLVVDLWKKFI